MCEWRSGEVMILYIFCTRSERKMYNRGMNTSQRNFAAAVSRLAHTNPFLPERIAAERAALGSDFSEPSTVWSRTSDLERPNVAELRGRIELLAAELQP